MNKLIYKASDDRPPKELSRVYFACHPDDFESTFDMLCEDIFATHNCVVYCREQMSEPLPPENREDDDLDSMLLFVIPVTKKLLTESSIARDEDIPFAQRHGLLPYGIRILPVVVEPGAGDLPEYTRYFGEMQYLDRTAKDESAVSYEKKLKDFLDDTLLDDDTRDRIREEFDAYVFLSYRKKDRRLANRLMRQIHSNRRFVSVSIWYDEYLVPGRNFRESIKEAMGKSKLFMLLVTPSLLEPGNYVQEVEYPDAREAELPIEPVLPIEVVEMDIAGLKAAYENIPEVVVSDDEDRLFGILSDTIGGYIKNVNDCSDRLYLMGLAYLMGCDVEINRELGIELLTEAGEAGNIRAIERLVSIYTYAEDSDKRWLTSCFNGNALYWMSRQYECYRKDLGYKNEKTLRLMLELAASGNRVVNESPEELLDKCLEYGSAVFESDDLFMLEVMFQKALLAGSREEKIQQKEKIYFLAYQRYGKNDHKIVERFSIYGYSLKIRRYRIGRANDLKVIKEIYENRCRELGKDNSYTKSLLRIIQRLEEYTDVDNITSAKPPKREYPDGYIDAEYKKYKEYLKEKEYNLTFISLYNALRACADTGDIRCKKSILEEVCAEESGRFTNENMPPTGKRHLHELSVVYEQLGELRSAAVTLQRYYDIEKAQNGDFFSDFFKQDETEQKLADLYGELGEYKKQAEMLCLLIEKVMNIRVIRRSRNMEEYRKYSEEFLNYNIFNQIITNCCKRNDLGKVSQLADRYPVILNILSFYAEDALENGNTEDAALIIRTFSEDPRLKGDDKKRFAKLREVIDQKTTENYSAL